jgi:hypothetical protein
MEEAGAKAAQPGYYPIEYRAPLGVPPCRAATLGMGSAPAGPRDDGAVMAHSGYFARVFLWSAPLPDVGLRAQRERAECAVSIWVSISAAVSATARNELHLYGRLLQEGGPKRGPDLVCSLMEAEFV